MNSVSTLSAQNDTRLSKEFWIIHARRWPLLEQARLVPTAVRAFRDMLAEDAPPYGPRLPSMTKLILVNVKLTAPRAYNLRDMLMERVEQGVPLEVLDLSTCAAGDDAIQLLTEIVVEPLAAHPMMMEEEPESFDWHGGIGYWEKVEYYDVRAPWYPLYMDEFDYEDAVTS
jgi:hypothetical protein